MFNLITGKDVTAPSGTLVKFQKEIYIELTIKHGVEFKSIQVTCCRIKQQLIKCSYIVKVFLGSRVVNVCGQDRVFKPNHYIPTEQTFMDLDYARTQFTRTKNLTEVRNEIIRRQEERNRRTQEDCFMTPSKKEIALH